MLINPAKRKDLARDRPTWRRTVKTGAAIFEANRIAAAKANREARIAQLRPPRNANAQPLPTCPRCQRTFRAPNGLVEHFRTNCSTRTALTVVPPSTSPFPSSPLTKSDRPAEPPLSSSSSSSSSPTASQSAAVASAAHTNMTHNPDTPTNINTTTIDTSSKDPVYTCPHCGRNFTSHIGLADHLRIHRTKIGEPVPGAAFSSTAHIALAYSFIAWVH
ncbi:hypothetical protein SprV_0100331700 [Sparganum proliferum]